MSKKFFLIIFLLVSSLCVFASNNVILLSGDVSEETKNIEIVRNLEKQATVPDLVVSSGRATVVAALYCAGLDSNTIQFALANMTGLLNMTIPIGSGFFDSCRYCNFIVSLIGGDIEIEDLPIPLVIVCQDKETNKPVFLTSGSLCEAIRASFANSFIYDSVTIDGTTQVKFEGNLEEQKESAKAHALAKKQATFDEIKSNWEEKRKVVLDKIVEYAFFKHVEMTSPLYLTCFSISNKIELRPSFYYKALTVKGKLGIEYEIYGSSIKPYAGLEVDLSGEHIGFDIDAIWNFKESKLEAQESLKFVSDYVNETTLLCLYQSAKTDVLLSTSGSLKKSGTVLEVGSLYLLPVFDLSVSFSAGLRSYVEKYNTSFIGLAFSYAQNEHPLRVDVDSEFEFEKQRVILNAYFLHDIEKSLDLGIVALNDIKLGAFTSLDTENYVIAGVKINSDCLLFSKLEIPITVNLGWNVRNKSFYFNAGLL